MANDKIYTAIIPPPVGGWNTRDPISNMAPEYAIELENFFPNFGTVDLVKGYRQHATGVGSGIVYGVAEYSYQGNRYLIATGVDNKIYNATSAGAATDITGATTPVNEIIYFQQFKNRLFMTSGGSSDKIFYWDGSGNCSFDPYGAFAAYGPMTIYKSRWYGAQVPDTIIGYSAVDSTSGTLTTFDVTSLLQKGGTISFIGSVTRAKDFSEDVLFCIISDQGEILVYQGDNPGSATWSLLGQYLIPRPLGRKAFFYLGANLCIMTSQGVIPMSEIMGGTPSGKFLTLSDPIVTAFTDAATTTLHNDNAWTGINYPRGNFVVCNIPVTSGSVTNQFYMNSTTQAWCKRTNQNAFCWALYNDELYFGGLNGKVFKADNGYFDEDPANTGQALTRTIKLRHAYNYFEDAMRVKQFTEAQPIIYQSEGLDLTLDINVDYADTTATSRLTDTADTSYKLYRPYMGLNGLGTAGSIRIDGTVTTKRASLQATKVFWNEGGVK